MNPIVSTPEARSYSFPKEEHLCRKKLIDELFGQGSSFGLYPLRLVWRPTESPATEPLQVLVSVSKRNFKRAVDRNYLKRLMREAYRLNKYRLLEAEGGHRVGLLAIIYTGKEKKAVGRGRKKINFRAGAFAYRRRQCNLCGAHRFLSTNARCGVAFL